MAKIFISSTTEDLRQHREAVVAALRSIRHDPVYLENPTADGMPPLDISRRLIDSCDLFVGILAWRYGFIPGDDERSFVELEHRYAWEKGLPTLDFLTHDNAAWPAQFVDRGPQADRQDRFRQEVLKRYTVSFFTSPDDLAQKVLAAVANWQNRRDASESPRPDITDHSSATPQPSLPPNVEPFELAWRLVVDRKADPALLRHMDLDQLREAVDAWAKESGLTESEPAQRYEAAQEQLRKKQADLAPHALWLAWMRTARAPLPSGHTPPPRHA